MILSIPSLAGVLLLFQVHARPICVLHPAHERWEGSCGTLLEGERTSLSIAHSPAITSGIWRREETPSAVWAGTIVVGKDPADPVEIEIYGQGNGVMRTLSGWFPVSHLTAAKDALSFDADASVEVPPSGLDREIVARAKQILSSAVAWNRADDRECPAEATTWSIYCAMEKATIQVAGAFHHRRPAMEVVRDIVDERAVNRGYHHRLMDYNNDPTTRLSDVQSLFDEALKRIDAALEPGGPHAAIGRGGV